MKKLSFERAEEMMKSLPCVVLDVREEEEYITGHAEGALLLPLDEITRDTCEVLIPDKAIPVVVYCRTGARSALAAEKLEKYGYTDVYDLGGLLGWPYGLKHGN